MRHAHLKKNEEVSDMTPANQEHEAKATITAKTTVK